MVLDYFAYWNGAQLRDLFEAVVAITSGPSYQGLIKSAVLAGFLVTLTTALFRWQGMAAKTFLFAVVLFYSLLLIPKTDLSIHDERPELYMSSKMCLSASAFLPLSLQESGIF